VPIALTDGKRDAYEPDIQLLDGDMLVAWYEKDPSSGALTARLGRFGLQGQSRWQLVLSRSDAKGRSAVVQLHDGQALVAWIETPAGGAPAIWTARVAADGRYLQPAQRAVTVSTDTWNLNAAVDSRGTFHVVYDARIGSRAKELHLLAISSAGQTERQLSADDGKDSVYPDLDFAGDRAALTWFDSRDGNTEIYLFVGDLGALADIDARSIRVTATPGESTGAYAAWNGERLGVAWCDERDGQAEIFGQEFSVSGKPLAAARRITHTLAQSSIPAIRPWRDGFALAWNEYEAAQADGHTAIVASGAMLSTMRD
jgi:hypothetical protein